MKNLENWCSWGRMLTLVKSHCWQQSQDLPLLQFLAQMQNVAATNQLQNRKQMGWDVCKGGDLITSGCRGGRCTYEWMLLFVSAEKQGLHRYWQSLFRCTDAHSSGCFSCIFNHCDVGNLRCRISGGMRVAYGHPWNAQLYKILGVRGVLLCFFFIWLLVDWNLEVSSNFYWPL